MTLAVPVLESDWTQVNVVLFGTVGNFGERDIFLREQLTKPSPNVTDGHILRPGENIRFSLTDELNLWARSVIAKSKVLVSAGVDAPITSVESNILLNRLLLNLGSQNIQIIEQLKLLNLHTQEMGDTGFTINDIDS